MRLTQECDYALRIMLHLACLPSGKREDAQTIANQQAVPLRFAIKILRKLVLSGIVRSFKGPNGGYLLGRDVTDISLYDIIQVIDGEMLINKCLDEDYDCTRIEKPLCVVRKELALINQDIVRKFDAIKLGALLQP